MEKNKNLEGEKKKKVPFNVFSKKGLMAVAMAGVMITTPFMLAGCADGKDGQDGTVWKSGTSYTTFTDAKVGDYFIDTDDYVLYQKGANGWTIVMENYGRPGTSGTNGSDGISADNIELRTSTTHIQWRYKTGTDTEWKNLIELATLKGDDGQNGTDGKEIKLQVTADYIQWQYDNETDWTNLIPLSSLKGADGKDGATWLSGTSAPTTEGKSGDFYLNESTYDIYKNTDGVWAKIGNIKGTDGVNGEGASILSGKSILAIGDSYVAGHTSPTSDTWISQLASRNNMTPYIYGTNGISVSHSSTSTSNGIVDNIDSILSNVEATDYVVFLAGHNDANPDLNGGSAVPIGTNSDTTATTYKGSLNIIIEKLVNKYPTSKILFLTPFDRRGTEEAYANAMMEVCREWAIPCFDNYHCSGIKWDNEAQKAAYESDSLHFNRAGHERISLMYESILENNLVINGGSYSSGTTTENAPSEEDTPTLTFAFAQDKTNRAIAYYSLSVGQKINFANNNTWETYKYAIGVGEGTGSTWIGGGYQTGECEITEDNTYTIMVAKQSDADFTQDELSTLASLFIIS